MILFPKQEKKNRFIHHYQFTSWPDHGVPDSPAPVLDFVRSIRDEVDMHHGPIVVHCRYKCVCMCVSVVRVCVCVCVCAWNYVCIATLSQCRCWSYRLLHCHRYAFAAH